MLQRNSCMSIADNTGAKKAMMIGTFGSSNPGARGIGDRIKVAIKEAIPTSSVKKGSVQDAVIVRTKSATRRSDGSYIRFDGNACVLIDAEGAPKGTRIFGPVARELRTKNYMKIISLAPEVW